MIKFLVKKLIKNHEDVKDNKVREKYGVLGGVLGIICNLILFAVKLIIGILVNAVAVMSDAFNNLTDSFSSIVGIISAKISNKKPDKDHPFGHGRIEYVSTLIVAFVILLVGFELLMSSGEKLLIGLGFIDGTIETIASGKTLYISLGILTISLLVKLWMYSYNKYLGNKVNSSVMLANSADSISDVLTSSAIIIATLLGALLLKDNTIIVKESVTKRMLNELVESSCKQKWILCSERLPGKGEDVLITNNWHEVRMAYLTDRTRGKVLCWIVDHNSYHPVDRNEILAWMALPHPYIEPTPSEEGETK